MDLHLKKVADKLSRHEMGHWIAARRLGFKPGSVKAKVTGRPPDFGRGGEAEITLQSDLSSLDDVADYLERRIQVCWAGVAAEALDCSNFRACNVPERCRVDRQEARRLQGPILFSEKADERQVTGRTDARLARELLHLLLNIRGNSLDGDALVEFNSLEERLWNKTVELIEAQSELIVGVAWNLSDKILEAGVDKVAILTATEIEEIPNVKKWVTRHGLGCFPHR